MKKLLLGLTILILSLGLVGQAKVANAVGTNLIANESVETANTAGTAPANWNQGKWGTNTTAFTYKTTEGHTGSKSLYVNMTKRTSGDAKWYFTNVAVKANQKYTYSEFYKSNNTTEIDIEYTNTSNQLSYVSLGTVAASTSTWAAKTATFTAPANVKSLTIFHVINKVGWVQTDDFSLVEGDGTTTPTTPAPSAPVVTITAPANNATIGGTQALTATATDAVAVAGVQFKVDNINVGTEDTNAPYSVNLDTKTLTNGNHSITATARNTTNVTATTTTTTNVIVLNPTAPTVGITAPANGSTVSGTAQTVTATATDAISIANVQFKLDGNNLGTADTTSPYSTTFDTTAVANGNHTLSAVATNTSGLTTTAASVTVSVQNSVVTPPVTPPAATNLISNPSFETANGTTPQGWLTSNWGTNTTAFSYLSTGHTGSRSVRVDVTSYSNGASSWYYAGAPVVSGKTYAYENWYQSNVDTEVDAEVVMNDGTVQYYWLGTVLANSAWTKYSNTFTVPAGAKSLAIYQIIAKKGYVVSDDYSLSEYKPQALNRGLVSITYDDGWANQYTNAFPLMQKYGLFGTYYIISGSLNDQPDYMSATQIKNLFNAGNEIGSHSVTHPDLTAVSQANLVTEMSQSQTTLQNLIGAQVTDFAYPLGAYNANTISVGSQYYQSQRTVNGGLNTKDNFNITTLKIQEIDGNTSQAQVKSWVDSAIAQKAWLILVIHDVTSAPTDPAHAVYTILPSDLDAELNYIKNSGVGVVTVNKAINEILPQL